MTRYLANTPTIAVVIPCFRVKDYILPVIESLPDSVGKIYVIDDACPEHTGAFVEQNINDPKVTVLYHTQNQGVGGAVLSGYVRALEDGCDIIVKVDGDGQMNGADIPYLIAPLLKQEADYSKGNRFYFPESLTSMPKIRLYGNAILSFANKLSSGYWNIFDPTNGFTAINAKLLPHLPLARVSKRFFFESDMLYHLSLLRAVVLDVPMNAKYDNSAPSNLKIRMILWPFFKGHIRNFFKRIGYNYYLRNFSIASLELGFGLLLVIFGSCYGAIEWSVSAANNQPATAGTVMVAALPIIVGFQMILSFLSYDILMTPVRPISPSLSVK